MRRLLISLLLFALPGFVLAENPPVQGGCVLGESFAQHGRAAEQGVARMRNYARLYQRDFSGFNRQLRTQQQKIYQFLEQDEWDQQDVLGFTREQREFLYMNIGAELATGRTDTSQLPGYASAVEQKLFNIEVELGCEALPDDAAE